MLCDMLPSQGLDGSKWQAAIEGWTRRRGSYCLVHTRWLFFFLIVLVLSDRFWTLGHLLAEGLLWKIVSGNWATYLQLASATSCLHRGSKLLGRFLQGESRWAARMLFWLSHM